MIVGFHFGTVSSGGTRLSRPGTACAVAREGRNLLRPDGDADAMNCVPPATPRHAPPHRSRPAILAKTDCGGTRYSKRRSPIGLCQICACEASAFRRRTRHELTSKIRSDLILEVRGLPFRRGIRTTDGTDPRFARHRCTLIHSHHLCKSVSGEARICDISGYAHRHTQSPDATERVPPVSSQKL